ncbi:LacI family DNA-binding transcriptional regulator [Alcaligenaceae bacterium]|nr:LacI family DNA-binding transcriptional regulator [Alcaligenaceae bacterium]
MKKNVQRSNSPVTIKDIASVLSVSNATVSRALADSPLISDRTKNRVRTVAAELGYVPDNIARMMRGEASNLVGFILPDVQNHFYSAMAKMLAENVSTIGLQLVLAISEGDPERELRHVRELRRARAQGIIVTPVADMLPETADLLSGMRTVQLVRSHPLVTADLVTAQDARAISVSTQYLLELGHRKIAYLGGGAEILDSGTNRLAGYRRAMSQVEGGVCMEVLTAPYPENGYSAARQILEHATPPSGLVIGSSQLAVGVLRAIREMNIRVPQDLSVISYDDPDWLQLCGPGISTIALPIAEMAHQAVNLIDARYQAKTDRLEFAVDSLGPAAKHFSFPVSLVERGSCMPPAI